MFKKKPDKPKRDHSGKNLSQYGLFEIPADFDTGLGNVEDDDNDSDLEAELAALANDGGAKPKKPARKLVPEADLNAMVADSMKDIPSDAELSGDDDDPDLLNELNELTGNEKIDEVTPEETQPSVTGTTNIQQVLNDRLKMYEIAESNAKTAGETSKVRRFGRAIKTLKQLIKDAAAGRPVKDEDIPPEVNIAPKKPPEAETNNILPDPQPEPEPIPTPEPSEQETRQNQQLNSELLSTLEDRQKQYKIAALRAKKSGDSTTAINYLKIVKQFDSVIEAVKRGEPVDLSRMPESPSAKAPKPREQIEENAVQKDSVPEPAEPPEQEESLVTASSIMEALEQRMGVYKAQESAAKEQGNSSKARRYGRIVKQFEDAIRLQKIGKPVPLDELPTPPGYGPFPTGDVVAPKPAPVGPKPARPVAPAPPPPVAAKSEEPESSGGQSARLSGNHVATSRAEKQVVILLAKQKQFKIAALNAKKKGELSQAKEFLRTAKGFDRLIDAARGGLPVDWSSIPVSPDAKSQLDNEYDIVMTDECTEDENGDIDIISRLENQLTKQLKMCLSTRDHNKALGDVAGTNRFERLALNVTKDLDTVRLAKKSPGARIPRFHYENKDFAIVKSFTELTDNDLELTIVRGINYTSTNPKEIDTYVKFEFPFPQDTPYSDKTATVKDTNNPEYNNTFTVPIQRTSRACQRVFKRHGIKFEVYSKGGFFRGDTLIGVANVKLQPLETQCELHDSFDLLEGRKNVGGKLEVRIRLRHPIITQQVEQVKEKWLIIDQ